VTDVPIILGFDPTTLRERIDVAAAEARLEEIGHLRSLSAMEEKVSLFRLLGRLDEAFSTAQAAYRQSRFTGSRTDALAARVRRAQVQQELGKRDAALVELNGCVDEAVAHDWHLLAAFALQHRGRLLFELDDYRAALADFERALELRTEHGAPNDHIQASKFAVRATQSILGGDAAPPSELPEPLLSYDA